MCRQLEILPYIEYVLLVMIAVQREKTGLPNPHLASLKEEYAHGVRLCQRYRSQPLPGHLRLERPNPLSTYGYVPYNT